MNQLQQVEKYMQRALKLAQKGLYTTNPNPRVGCVIVKNNTIVGEGFHQISGTEHAEIHALNQAGEQAKDADVYVTLEPCCHYGKTPPCSNALINAAVKRVFIAMLDPNPLVAGKGKAQLQEAGIIVENGFLQEQAKQLNIGFIKRMESELPWVRLKMASSVDGRTAMASGESQWITGKEARGDVQKLRARASIVITGVETVLFDDPSMNVRIKNELNPEIEIKQPIRCVLDSKGRLSGKENLFKIESEIWIVTLSDQLEKKLQHLPHVKVIQAQAENQRISLTWLMSYMAEQQINEVHLECGATLAGAFMQQKLVDEMVLYVAPKLMGSTARPIMNLNLPSMAEAIEFKSMQVNQIGRDFKITALF